MKSKMLTAAVTVGMAAVTVTATAGSASAAIAETQVRNWASGHCVEYTVDGPEMDTCVRSAAQVWEVDGIGGSWANIRLHGSSECLTVVQNLGLKWLDIEPCNSVASQYFTWKGSSTYRGGNMFWNPQYNVCLDGGQLPSLVHSGPCSDTNPWQNWQLSG